MKSNYKRLDEYIRIIDVRNQDLKITKLLGVSITKRFIPSIANIIGTDLRNYKVVKKGQFAYGPVTSRNGDKISVALLEEDDCIISSSYSVFEVKDQDKLNPEYLMLWFQRPEFDRYARFHSHGSVREIFDWDEMCNVELPVPSLERQLEIVKAYKAIEKRIKAKKSTNDNLQQQAFFIYKKAVSKYDMNAQLSDIAHITMGVSPEGESLNSTREGISFYQGKTDFGFRFPSVRQYTTEAKRYAEKKDILMSVRAPVGPVNIATEKCAIGRGLAAIRPKDQRYSYLYYTMLKLDFELNKFNDEGTVFGSITKDDLHALRIVNIRDEEKTEFEHKASVIDAAIFANELEIMYLKDAMSFLLREITN